MNKNRKFGIFSGRAAALLTAGLLVGTLTTGCRKVYRVEQAGAAARPQQVDLTAAQAISVRQEMESIEAFVARSGWDMRQSGTGLWYEIYTEAAATAPKVEYGNAVKAAYTLRLLNGSLVEEYTEERPRTWILGKSELTAGLSEALMMLKKGSKARFILPSHLAYGFSGNGTDIPPRATLLYDLEVLEVLVNPER